MPVRKLTMPVRMVVDSGDEPIGYPIVLVTLTNDLHHQYLTLWASTRSEMWPRTRWRWNGPNPSDKAIFTASEVVGDTVYNWLVHNIGTSIEMELDPDGPS
jgi:hypothetical protein